MSLEQYIKIQGVPITSLFFDMLALIRLPSLMEFSLSLYICYFLSHIYILVCGSYWNSSDKISLLWAVLKFTDGAWQWRLKENYAFLWSTLRHTNQNLSPCAVHSKNESSYTLYGNELLSGCNIAKHISIPKTMSSETVIL